MIKPLNSNGFLSSISLRCKSLSWPRLNSTKTMTRQKDDQDKTMTRQKDDQDQDQSHDQEQAPPRPEHLDEVDIRRTYRHRRPDRGHQRPSIRSLGEHPVNIYPWFQRHQIDLGLLCLVAITPLMCQELLDTVAPLVT